MVYRFLRQMLNNPKVIQELADSPPIRQAAKLIVRTAATAEERFSQLKLTEKAGRITQIYKEEYKKAIDKK